MKPLLFCCLTLACAALTATADAKPHHRRAHTEGGAVYIPGSVGGTIAGPVGAPPGAGDVVGGTPVGAGDVVGGTPVGAGDVVGGTPVGAGDVAHSSVGIGTSHNLHWPVSHGSGRHGARLTGLTGVSTNRFSRPPAGGSTGSSGGRHRHAGTIHHSAPTPHTHGAGQAPPV